MIDDVLAAAMAAAGAVLIEGPRGCGKTATATQATASQVRLDTDVAARNVALLDPSLVLEGARPRLIDEWQLVPDVWNHVRRAVDDEAAPGQFVLTGSSVVPHGAVRHSGAGRILRLRMLPMSLHEAGVGTGTVSLAALMRGEPARAGDTPFTVPEIARAIAIGGWPALLGRTPAAAQSVLRSYLVDAAKRDMVAVDGVRRDPDRVARVLASLARYTAAQVSSERIAADVGGEDGPIKAATVRDYTNALEQIFIVEDLPAWAPALRSRSRLREAAKRHFADPSLAVAALKTGADQLTRQVDTLGLLFESLVVRDLRVHAQALDAEVSHYHDNTGLEVDAVVQLRDGTWGAFEVKLGQKGIDVGAESLVRLARERVDTGRHGEPAVLAVITGWGYGYRRPDGVSVIPIRALAP